MFSMKTTTEITVGSKVVIVGAGPYRGMHGVVTDVDAYGGAIVALEEAAGTHLATRRASLAAA